MTTLIQICLVIMSAIAVTFFICGGESKNMFKIASENTKVEYISSGNNSNSRRAKFFYNIWIPLPGIKLNSNTEPPLQICPMVKLLNASCICMETTRICHAGDICLQPSLGNWECRRVTRCTGGSAPDLGCLCGTTSQFCLKNTYCCQAANAGGPCGCLSVQCPPPGNCTV